MSSTSNSISWNLDDSCPGAGVSPLMTGATVSLTTPPLIPMNVVPRRVTFPTLSAGKFVNVVPVFTAMTSRQHRRSGAVPRPHGPHLRCSGPDNNPVQRAQRVATDRVLPADMPIEQGPKLADGPDSGGHQA